MIVEGIFKDLDPDIVKFWHQECDEGGSDCRAVFGGTKPAGSWLQQRPGEYARWLALLASNVKPLGHTKMVSYLEIGSAAGGSMRLAEESLLSVYPTKLFSIDNGKHVQARFFTMWLGQHTGWIDVWIDDSHSDDTKQWLADHNQIFNAVFVDGDHSPPGVLQDLDMIRPYLDEHSLVGCHDAMGCAKTGIDQAVASGKWKSVGFAYDEEWHRHMGIRVLQKV